VTDAENMRPRFLTLAAGLVLGVVTAQAHGMFGGGAPTALRHPHHDMRDRERSYAGGLRTPVVAASKAPIVRRVAGAAYAAFRMDRFVCVSLPWRDALTVTYS
jgi:hypothetical protein